MNIHILPAMGDKRTSALRLLLARFPVEEQEIRLRDTLAASDRGMLNLDHLLLAESEGLSVGAALVMLQADGVALVWPPVVSCGATNEMEVEDLLMQEICRRVDAANARLGQCLLNPEDTHEFQVLSRHDFAHAADMFFLARTLLNTEVVSDVPDQTTLSNLKITTYSPESHERFASVIEATYCGSLDCPYLNGHRNGRDAIVSHQLSGEFDPSRWGLFSIDGKDAGVLLLNDHPDQDSVELVYLGVVPEKRGLGLGRSMLMKAIHACQRRGRSAMFLAVDCENRFANALYAEFQFAELARRRVMLRRPSRLARQ